jgi:hypothetical protein
LSALPRLFEENRETQKSSEDIAAYLSEVEPSIRQLEELIAAGMLEPHILLFRADADIAQHYPAYREKHRQKIREYLIKYYLHL